MKILFWGTPETSVPFLEFVSEREQVVGVVTQPDRPADRGQKLHASPAKLFALEKKLPVLQPASLKSPEFLSELSKLNAETGIVVAYGRILPPEVIRLFPQGLYNIHFSLLPRLRGAAPIQWAILRGDPMTGVTSFRLSESLDTGNILVQKSLEISPNDNAISLEENLVALGLTVLEETLRKLKSGNVTENPQPGEGTLAPLIKKADYRINWNKPAEEIARQARALVKSGATAQMPSGKMLKILRAESHRSDIQGYAPGTVTGVEKGRGFLIQCGIGTLLIIKVRLEGKSDTDAWSFLQGSHLKTGDKLT